MSSYQSVASGTSYILVAKMDNARNLSSLLKAIQFKDVATVFVSSNGLKITVEESKYLQASAFVQASVFQEYTFTEESATFRVNLTVLVECLHIFGSTKDGPGGSGMTALKMCYAGHGTPLKLLLVEEGGILTDCSVNTHEPEDIVDFNFCNEDVVNKLIMKSVCLKDAFQELDTTSEVIEIVMSPDSPFFRISTFGHSGSSHIDYAKDCEMIESFDCAQFQSNRYKLSLMKPATKALAASSKVSMRMDSRGFLSMQYMVINEDGQVCFVEYLCTPDEEMQGERDDEFS